MQPDKIETKRLKLVGVEMYISEEEDFGYKMVAMRAEIKNRLEEIKNKTNIFSLYRYTLYLNVQ